MIDFKIDQLGDLTFSRQKKIDQLRINFNVAENPTLRIRFKARTRQKGWSNNKLRIRFNTNYEKFNENCCVDVVRDDEELNQAIAIRIKTEYDELQNFFSEFGSEINRLRHSDLLDSKNHARIKEYVERAIASIILGRNVSVNVERVIDTDSSNTMGVETLKITVFDDSGKLVYSFRL